jgi:phenylalanyl-tRNA synthetase alpha subunit
LVADRDLTLGDLLGVIAEFFKKLGIKKIRFKPAYNPYTEPSMEIFSYHEGLQKWVEIGNSGIFRPEMLLPMGLPEDVNVIAWGLSLERLVDLFMIQLVTIISGSLFYMRVSYWRFGLSIFNGRKMTLKA